LHQALEPLELLGGRLEVPLDSLVLPDLLQVVLVPLL
jgi:hypothetical protein